ncbi:MAG: DUF2254 family protein [Myxococcota bacterium]
MTPSDHRPHMLRTWLLPLSILLGCALAVFLLLFWIDAAGEQHPLAALRLFFQPNPDSAMGTLSNAAEVVAAVLAIAITVVAIVVELAANRYTHRITELFVAEPTNFVVMGFFVVTALICLWVSLTFDVSGPEATGFVPYVGTGVAMLMLALCLLLLLPYFAFVFTFLSPVQIVERIRRHTIDEIRAGRRADGPVTARQREAVRGVEQLADVGLNAMENKDKGVSMASANALCAMILDYERLRGELPDGWFRVEGELANNPDFVSMAPTVLEDVSRRRIWLEMKVLRQYQTIYNEALNRMRDMNYLIAINTRTIAEEAMKRGHPELFDLVVKFFNTFLRATVNARDVRTAYNVLNQYRLLAENVLDRDPAKAVEIARYFKYYGLTSYGAKLPFILETVAYDLCTLNERAFDRGSPAARELLKIFLEVDKESESEVQEASLRGVRKAQIKLATHYLQHGAVDRARMVYEDMKGERPERLASIRDELLGVRSSEFWEISDRGVNFDYLPPERKQQLMTFFEWFGDRLPPPRRSRLPSDPPAAAVQPPAVAAKRPRRAAADASLHDVPGAGLDPATEDEEEEEGDAAPGQAPGRLR